MKKTSNIRLSILLTTSFMLPLAALSARGVTQAENNAPARPVAAASAAKPGEGVAPRLATALISQLDAARDALLTDQNSISSLKQAIDAVSAKVSAATDPVETQVDAAAGKIGTSGASIDARIQQVAGDPAASPATFGILGSDSGGAMDGKSNIFEKVGEFAKQLKSGFDSNSENLQGVFAPIEAAVGGAGADLKVNVDAIGSSLDNNYDPNNPSGINTLVKAVTEAENALGDFAGGSSLREDLVSAGARVAADDSDPSADNSVAGKLNAVLGDPTASPPTSGIFGSGNTAIDAATTIEGKLEALALQIDPSFGGSNPGDSSDLLGALNNLTNSVGGDLSQIAATVENVTAGIGGSGTDATANLTAILGGAPDNDPATPAPTGGLFGSDGGAMDAADNVTGKIIEFGKLLDPSFNASSNLYAALISFAQKIYSSATSADGALDAVLGDPAATPPVVGIIGSGIAAVDAEPDIHGKVDEVRKDIDPGQATLIAAVQALNTGFGY